MPKRSNDFQRLVYLVRTSLATGATVTESKLLRDHVTRTKREVDVCIEALVGGQPVLLCIECRDHKRPADVGWVEALKAKHERLNTNALLLVSRTGFTPEARRVAAEYRIQTVELQDIERTDFPTLLSAKSTLWTRSVIATPIKVVAHVPPISGLHGEGVELAPDNALFSASGTQICSARALVDIALKSSYTRDSLLKKGTANSKHFQLRWKPPTDLEGKRVFLKKLYPAVLREVASLQIIGTCQFKIAPFALRRSLLGDVHVAWGKSKVEGKDLMFVATRDPQGVENVTIHVDESFDKLNLP